MAPAASVSQESPGALAPEVILTGLSGAGIRAGRALFVSAAKGQEMVGILVLVMLGALVEVGEVGVEVVYQI